MVSADLAVGRFVDRFGRVFHKVQKHLHELIAVGEDQRQRRVVFLDDTHMAREPGRSEPLHMLEHGVDVHRRPLHRPLIREHFHAVDQRHDAVGLVADQPRERPVLVRRRLFQELGGAADAGERVLDFVRSMEASADTERGRRRCVSCRSILSAMVRSCSTRIT